MEIFIWGVTPVGKYLVNNVFNGEKYIKPTAFVDNNSELYNTTIEGLSVISCEELLKRNKINEVIILVTCRNAAAVFQIFQQLSDMPIRYLGIVKPSVFASKKPVNPWLKDGNVTWKVFDGEVYRVIPRLEVSLIDACNLKCKGCEAFASIYKQDSVYCFDNFAKDLKSLRKVGQYARIVLIGGEVFLLKNLDQYITMTRKLYPEADIEIVTNGLLIPSLDEKVLLSIKENDAFLSISPYIPTLKIKEKIIEVLDKYKIGNYFDARGEIKLFRRTLMLKAANNAEKSNKVCPSSGCMCLRGGKLYKCAVDAQINDVYSYYGLEERNTSGIDIHADGNVLYKKIVDYALKPVEMCKHCNIEEPEWIPWSVEAKPALEDWLYKDGAYEKRVIL